MPWFDMDFRLEFPPRLARSDDWADGGGYPRIICRQLPTYNTPAWLIHTYSRKDNALEGGRLWPTPDRATSDKREDPVIRPDGALALYFCFIFFAPPRNGSNSAVRGL